MPTFSNLRDINNYIRQKTLDNQKIVAKKVKNLLRENTDKLLYLAQKPEYYVRTMELIESITVGEIKKINNNTHSIKIYFDSDKIIPKEVNENWNQHMSTDKYKTDESKNVAYYMEYGHGGLYDQEPIEMVKTTKEQIEADNFIKEELKRELIKYGFKIVN